MEEKKTNDYSYIRYSQRVRRQLGDVKTPNREIRWLCNRIAKLHTLMRSRGRNPVGLRVCLMTDGKCTPEYDLQVLKAGEQAVDKVVTRINSGNSYSIGFTA